MNEHPNYYAIIPADVRYDAGLRANEKLMYGEITALANKTGECWASNQYFADLYSVTPQAISKWIKDLRDSGYISVDIAYKQGTKEVDKRIIRIVSTNVSEVSTNVSEVSTNVDGVSTNVDGGYQQKVKGNNTRVNNKLNNNKRPPSVEDVRAYCEQRNNGIDPEAFVDYYAQQGWKLANGNPMKDWQAAVRTWEKRNKSKPQTTGRSNVYIPEPPKYPELKPDEEVETCAMPDEMRAKYRGFMNEL